MPKMKDIFGRMKQVDAYIWVGSPKSEGALRELERHRKYGSKLLDGAEMVKYMCPAKVDIEACKKLAHDMGFGTVLVEHLG